MKFFKDKIVKTLESVTCDHCGKQAKKGEYEFQEFISVNHTCGYGSIHGDGNQIVVDLCQQCFADLCGDNLIVTSPNSEPGINSTVEALEYQNIFDVVSQSKQGANCLELGSDIQIRVRDILCANQITNQQELNIALKRVEQLWEAQCNTAEGNELHILADLICAYEKKDWDSYFNEIPSVSDDFMRERENIMEQKGAALGTLSDIRINKGVDDDESLESSIED